MQFSIAGLLLNNMIAADHWHQKSKLRLFVVFLHLSIIKISFIKEKQDDNRFFSFLTFYISDIFDDHCSLQKRTRLIILSVLAKQMSTS